MLTTSRAFMAAVLATAGALVVLAAACGGDAPERTVTVAPTQAPEPPPTVAAVETPTEPSPTVAAVETPTAPPQATPTPSPEAALAVPDSYDSNEMMYRLFDELLGSPRATSEGLELTRLAGDVSQVPVLVDILHFMGRSPLLQQVGAVLGELTGGDLASYDSLIAREWLGANAARYRPPDTYPQWKTFLFTRIHPRFAIFLETSGETSRIDLTEVVWGGVRPDGIPDLRDPLVLPAAAADFLEADERVFGVSINGENRAYPLRVINAHEMVNDVLGDEPISLAW